MGWIKIAAISVLTFGAFDFLWFFRLACVIVMSKLKRKLTHQEESVIYGMCTTQDLDFVGHMNNARYFRELDFARFDYFLRSGLYNYIFGGKKKGYCVIHSSTIRYRRSIDFLRFFAVKSRIVWWDSRTLFFEHRFITLADGFVRAIAYSRCSIVNINVSEMMKELSFDETPQMIEGMPEEIRHWIQFNDVSSQKLKQELLLPSMKDNFKNLNVSKEPASLVYCSSSENLINESPRKS